MSTEVVETDSHEPEAAAPEYSLLARLGAEVFGTFVLVLLGVGVALFATINAVAGNGLAVALAFGLAVMAGVAAVGHISGAHFNPAVSLAAAISGRISWTDLLPYWVAQLVGGSAAAGLLYVLIPSGLPNVLGAGSVREFFSATSTGYGDHSPTATLLISNGIDATGSTFDLLPALLVEVVLTAVFVGVILAVTDKRAKSTIAPLVIGLTLTAVVFVGAPVTNGSFNPARSTATAFFSDSWALNQLWLFWVAPLIGGAIAGMVYLLVRPSHIEAPVWDEEDAEGAEDLLDELEGDAAAEAAEAEAEADAIDAALAQRASAKASDPEPEEGEDGSSGPARPTV